MVSSKNNARLLSCKDVADRYGVTVETVRRWARKGIIEVVLVGPTKRIRITEQEASKHFKTARA